MSQYHPEDDQCLIFVVLDSSSQPVAYLDASDRCYEGRCGGCGCCLLAQASYAGMRIMHSEEWKAYPQLADGRIDWLLEGF